MKTIYDRKSFCFLLLIAVIISSCCDTSITNYKPKNQDERKIISLLIRYHDAKNHFDIEKLLSCLDDQGEFSFECGLMVSKAKLVELLPVFWAELKSGNPAVIPLVHECINGNYYSSGELNNAKIEIKNDKAEVTVLFTKGVCRVPFYLSMNQRNDQWLINRTEWGDG